MCIMMVPSVEANGTVLINVPLRTADDQPQGYQLTYINNVEKKDNASKVSPLMVVPLPNEFGMGELDFTLFEVNGSFATEIRDSVKSLASSVEYEISASFSISTRRQLPTNLKCQRQMIGVPQERCLNRNRF